MKINAIGIEGSGPAACALAEALVIKGFQVRMHDFFKTALKTALARITWSLSKAGKSACQSNIELVQDLKLLGGADLIIEIGTSATDKGEFLRKLCENVGPECVVAVSCGIEPIAPLVASLPNPERILGFNFHLPLKTNQLVEVVHTDIVSGPVLERCAQFLRDLGKTPVVARDSAGVIVERLRRPYILSALKLLENGKGLPNQLDAAMREVGGFPLGPFEMADQIGLDRDFQAADAICKLLHEPDRLKPSALENRLVQYGQIGRKTGVGFYLYDDTEIVGENPVLADLVPYLGIKHMPPPEVFHAVVNAVAEEARLLASEAMVSEFDMETAVKLGLGWPKGPLTLAKEMTSSAMTGTPLPQDQWGEAI